MLNWLIEVWSRIRHKIRDDKCYCNKTANFLELDKINKFKVIFDIHHRITAKFILRCYQLRKESLYRI